MAARKLNADRKAGGRPGAAPGAGRKRFEEAKHPRNRGKFASKAGAATQARPARPSAQARLERIRAKVNQRGRKAAASAQYHHDSGTQGDAFQRSQADRGIARAAFKQENLRYRFHQAQRAAAKLGAKSEGRPVTPKAKGTRAERLAALAKRAEARPGKLQGARKEAALDRSIKLKRAAHAAEKHEQAGRVSGKLGSRREKRRAAYEDEARRAMVEVGMRLHNRHLPPHSKESRELRAKYKAFKERLGLMEDGKHVPFGQVHNPREQIAGPAKPEPSSKASGRNTAERSKSAALLKRLRQQKAEAASKAAPKGPDPSGHVDHAPGHVGDVKRDLIHFDPHRFQYKQDVLSHDTGSVGSLAGVKKWDPELAGVVQVWKDPADGRAYVVNGHNRLDLARKIGVDKVTVRFLEAKDAAEARAKGALTNIAEGRGTAMDAAKFFKDSGISKKDLEARGIPMREKIADDGLALANLNPRVFRRVIDGQFTQERGAIIGRAGLSEPQQNALVDLIDKKPKGHNLTNEVLKELTDTVKSSASKSSGGFDLFGDTGEQSLALHKASLQASIKTRLSREKKLFGTVAKSKAASDLERGGNKIDTATSGAIARDATEGLAIFDQLKNVSGPISKRLNAAAERVNGGENRRKVEDETYREILANLKEAYQF